MDRVFNNADSFAMAFDESWQKQLKTTEFSILSVEDRKHYLFKNCIQDHPFLINDPEGASQVANFRIRLLGLDKD